MKRILFIGHDASRTGAPMVLLYFMQWLNARDDAPATDLLLLEGGPLEQEYKECANVFVVPRKKGFIWKVVRRISAKLRIRTRFDPSGVPVNTRSYDAVLGNTILSLDALSYFEKSGAATICWVHELDYIVKLFFTPDRFAALMQNADRVAAGSAAVRNYLLGSGIKNTIDVVYEFIPTRGHTLPAGPGRNDLGIPNNSFVVLGCGLVGWRKGVDIFIKIAEKMTSQFPDIHFVWIGGPPPGRDKYSEIIEGEIERLDLGNRLIMTGELTNIGRLFAEADVFSLTSLEDAFPLVCLHAAENAKPIICFEGAGGMPEFVGSDAGKIVANADVDSFAAAIETYYEDREQLRQDGANAKRKLESEFSMERSCEKLLNIIKSAG